MDRFIQLTLVVVGQLLPLLDRPAGPHHYRYLRCGPLGSEFHVDIGFVVAIEECVISRIPGNEVLFTVVG